MTALAAIPDDTGGEEQMTRMYLAQPLLRLRLRPLSALWWKRPLDLVLGTIALVVALPLILCLALAVVL